MVNQTLSKYVVKDEDIDSASISEGGYSIVFYRQFNMVVMMYHIATTEWTNTIDHTIMIDGSIPTAFRPSSDVYQTIINYDSTIKNGLMTIKPNGGLKFRLGTANTDMNVYGSISYVVED